MPNAIFHTDHRLAVSVTLIKSMRADLFGPALLDEEIGCKMRSAVTSSLVCVAPGFYLDLLAICRAQLIANIPARDLN